MHYNEAATLMDPAGRHTVLWKIAGQTPSPGMHRVATFAATLYICPLVIFRKIILIAPRRNFIFFNILRKHF